MATPRKVKSGKWELAVHHKDLPKGRRYFSFDTEEEAQAFAERWKLIVKSGVALPPELTEQPGRRTITLLSQVIRAWIASGLAAKADVDILNRVSAEVGMLPLMDVTYKWALSWVQDMKVESNLAPGTIRARVGALARSIDHHLKLIKNPDFNANPLRALPRGYATYTDTDSSLAQAAGGSSKSDVMHDRRLKPGEHEKILEAIGDHQDLRMLYLLIVFTGLRLKEAATLSVAQIDLKNRVIRAQTSKQWRGRVKHRNVPIRRELFEPLSVYVSDRVGLMFPFVRPEEDYDKVRSRLSQAFKRAFVRAGINDLREHDLRHEATCAWYELRRADGSWMFRDEEINKFMGWSPGSRMASRYASFRVEDLAARLWE